MCDQLILCVVLLFATACELQEIVIADAEPFVVVEAYLVGNSNTQTIGIHASAGAGLLIEDDARVVLHGPTDSVVFTRTNAFDCVAANTSIDPEGYPGGLACYSIQPTPEGAFMVEAGELYRLEVVLPDGRWLAGTTRVPDQVTFVPGVGAAFPCYLEPWTQAELTWRSTAGIAAYQLELRASGVREALARAGIEAEVPEPLILRGLAIGTEDTTIVLPREFGLFDRFALDPALLVALQEGMPPEIDFDVTLAATDHNYVDWVRGGDFNPSGLIRVPSMHGTAGTGVLASMTLDSFVGSTAEVAAANEPCAPPPSD